jgi:hypothetical protein
LHKLIDLTIKKPQIGLSNVPDELDINSQTKLVDSKEEPLEADEIKANVDNQEGEGSQNGQLRKVE